MSKITQAEMIELFGEAMPIEAVNLLFNAPGDKTLVQIRAELREIAARQKPMTEQTDKLVEQPAIFAFLLGSGPLNGVWWGEAHRELKPFWWREYLKAAVDERAEHITEIERLTALLSQAREPNVATVCAFEAGIEAGLEEAATALEAVEPDEEAAGGAASWADFVQVGQSAIRSLSGKGR